MFSIYLFRKFDPSSSNDLKVQNFGSHISGKSSILVSPNFVRFYFFVMFAYSENFMCLTRVVKKLQFWRTRFGETPILVPPNFVKFYVPFMFTYVKNFVSLA